ncbi:hypothetical protein [Clostridium sporogenes]|nr:hypothetical protein [Clostridium sporogenes]
MKRLCKISIEENSKCKICCKYCNNPCENKCVFTKTNLGCNNLIEGD